MTKQKTSMNKLSLSILISIILTIILIALVNVGLSIFIESPEYNDYCDEIRPSPMAKDVDMPESCPEDARLCSDGTSVSRKPHLNCEFPTCPNDYKQCQEDYEEARDDFNQKRFYVFAIIGFTFLLVGLFNKEILIQITGLAAGGILVFQGVVTNFQDKIVTFIALLLILIIFGILAYRIVNKD
jgi:hypothetical protein